MKKRILVIASIAVLVVAATVFALAQGHRGMGQGGMRGGPEEMIEHISQALSLTDAQKEQLRAAGKQNREANRAQHDELRQLAEKRRQGSLTPAEEERAKALRDEIRASMQKSHEGLLSILTAEQKTKLEQLRSERRQHFDEMRDRHRNRGDKSPVKPGEIQ